jgi:GAF domain-containing protein
MALAREAATAEVLRVINSSPGDLTPVFDTLLEKAMRLCEAAFGEFIIAEGERVRAVAVRGAPAAFAEIRMRSAPPTPGSIMARVLAREPVIHTVDASDDDLYRRGDPHRLVLVDLAGARTTLAVTLIKDGAVLGTIHIYREEVKPFTDKQIALLQNFAAQAVIAMENARLLTETREALEQQTATAEVLQVINSSPGDLAPVFDAILEKAYALCGAAGGDFLTFDGEFFRSVAARGMTDRFTRTITKQPYRLHPDNPANVLVRGEQPFVHVADLAELTALLAADPMARAALEWDGEKFRGVTMRGFSQAMVEGLRQGYIPGPKHPCRRLLEGARVAHCLDLAEIDDPVTRAGGVAQGGVRTILFVALRKDDVLLGQIVAVRREVRPFSEKEIALVENFAAQAVIAIENARLDEVEFVLNAVAVATDLIGLTQR